MIQAMQLQTYMGTDAIHNSTQLGRCHLLCTLSATAVHVMVALSVCNAMTLSGQASMIESHIAQHFLAAQDLVEELSRQKHWWTPNKLSQQTYDRNADGSFAGFEEEVCLCCVHSFCQSHLQGIVSGSIDAPLPAMYLFC